MSRRQTSSQSTIKSTQPPQDTSARQTLMLFSSPEPLLQGTATLESVTINLIDSMHFTHELLLCFTFLHISNGSVSTSLVEHILYSVDLMPATCIPHLLLMVHRYIYSRYSSVFLTLYQLYHSLPSSTLISSSSLYLKLQPELLLKVVTERG